MDGEKEGNDNVFNSLDHSVLKQPVHTGVQNIQQVLSCVQNGSPEVRNIIMNECDILYECKVCRNLFRGLPNLIAHKRFYCKDSFCEVYKHPNNEKQESTLIIQPEDAPETEFEELEETCSAENEENDKSSELTEIRFEPLPIFHSPNRDSVFQRRASSSDDLDVGEEFDERISLYKADADPHSIIELQKIKGNPNAVIMSVALPDDSPQVIPDEEQETNVVKDKKDDERVAEASQSPEDDFSTLTHRKQLMKMSSCCVKTLRCLKCRTSYTTVKTLYNHMKSIHATKRVYYPCPICKTSFLKFWGVQRHLASVHHKSKEQIKNKYSEIIKRHAFTKRVVGNTLGKRKLFTQNEERRYDAETSATQNNYVCKKCGRCFDRRSSIVNHVKFCNPKTHFVEGKSQTKMPNVESGTSNNKGVTLHKCFKCSRSFSRKTSQLTHTKFCKGKPLVLQQASNPVYTCCYCRRVFDRKPAQLTHTKFCKFRAHADEATVPKPVVNIYKKPEEMSLPMEQIRKPEPKIQQISNMNVLTRPKRTVIKKTHSDFVSSQTLKWRSANKVESTEDDSDKVKHESHRKSNPVLTIQELKDFNHIERKVLSIINMEKLRCLRCKKRFSSFSNAKRHAATYHIGWMRFKCQHCSYKSYNKSDCRNHIERVHHGSNETPIEVEPSNETEFKYQKDTDKSSNNSSPPKPTCKSPVPCVSVKKLHLPEWADKSIKLSPEGLVKQKQGWPQTTEFIAKKSKPTPYHPIPVKRPKPLILQNSPKKLVPIAQTQTPPVTAKKTVPIPTSSAVTVTAIVEESLTSVHEPSQKSITSVVDPGPTLTKSTFHQDLVKIKEDLQRKIQSSTTTLSNNPPPMAKQDGLEKVSVEVKENSDEKDHDESQQGSAKTDKQKMTLLEHDNSNPDSEDLQSLLKSASELFEVESSTEDKPSGFTSGATRILIARTTDDKKSSWRNTTTSPFITKLVRITPAPSLEKKDIATTTAPVMASVSDHEVGNNSTTILETNESPSAMEVDSTDELAKIKADAHGEAANVATSPPLTVMYPSPMGPKAIPRRFVVKASPQKCVVKPPKRCGQTSTRLPSPNEENQSVTAGDHAYMATSQQPTVVVVNSLGSPTGRTFTVSVVNPDTYHIPEGAQKKCIAIVKKTIGTPTVQTNESTEPSAAETEAAVQSVVL